MIEILLVLIAVVLIIYLIARSSKQKRLRSSIEEHKSFALAGGEAYRQARAQCTKSSKLLFASEPDGRGNYQVHVEGLGPVGHLTPASDVAKAIARGQTVLQSSISSCRADAVRVKVVTGEPGAEFAVPKPQRRTYFSPIVGEKSYQQTIRTIEQGDDVEIVREHDNPYDTDALCVRTVDDEPIGYIAKDSWLRRAIIDEGKGCRAWVDYIAAEPGAPKGVRLGLVLEEGPIEERSYITR